MMAKKNYFCKMLVWLYCFLLVFCFSKKLYAQFASDVSVNDDATIYDQSISNGTPSIVIYENDIYATWLDARAGVTNGYDVYFAKGNLNLHQVQITDLHHLLLQVEII